MKRYIKLGFSLFSLCLVAIAMTFAVFAYSSTTYNINSTVSYLIEWDIDYELNGGTIEGQPNRATYNIETPDFTLTNPTKFGYTFSGWTGTDLSAPTQLVTVAKGSIGERYYEANWNAIDYTITYNLDGGTASNPDGYNIDTPDFTLNYPTKTGYTFIGWTGSNGETPQLDVTIAKGTTGNKTYTANWELTTYNISYVLNGGTVSSANPETYTYLTNSFTLNNPSKTGYTFSGWTGTGLTSATNTVTIAKGSTGDRTYTANWTQNTYTITIEVSPEGYGTVSQTTVLEVPFGTKITSNGNTVSINGTTVTATPQAADGEWTYSFSSWTNGTATVTGELTITANFTRAHTIHNVTYDATTNGGTGSTTAQVAYGSAIDLTKTASKTDWTFVGWNTSSTATTKLTSLTMGTSDVTLYAIFSKTLTASFYQLSATSVTTVSTTIYNTATSGSITAPALTTVSGLTIVGWGTSTTATASSVAGSASLSISSNPIYYAVYSYTVTASYNANGGSGTTTATTGTAFRTANATTSYYTTNASVTLANNNFTKLGFSFAKWAEGSASGTQYSAGEVRSLSASATYYAIWANNVAYLRTNWKDLLNSTVPYESIATLDFANSAPSGYTSTGISVGGKDKNGTSAWSSSAAVGGQDITVWSKVNAADASLYDVCLVAPNNAEFFAPVRSSSLFSGLSKATSINVSKLNTTNVTNMYGMFYGCLGLTSLAVSNFDTTNVTDTSYMFAGCEALTSLDVSNFDTTNVTDMSAMFHSCFGLTSLDVSNFDTTNVTDMSSMFDGCEALTSLAVSNFDTTNVTNTSHMFAACEALTSLAVSNFDTTNVTNMSSMFAVCNALTSLDVSNFDTTNVTNTSYMFSGCNALTSLDVSNFDTTNVTNMSSMFSGCNALTSLTVSNFDTTNVTNMSFMFYGCNALTSLTVSNFDTTNVTNMSYMFSGCNALTSLDVSNFDTTNVTNMSYMFSGCNALSSLDVSSFDTSNVTNMLAMFNGCNALSSLDVSSFDTSNVTNMSTMFNGCNALTSLDLSSFTIGSTTAATNMFSVSLKTLKTPESVGKSIDLPHTMYETSTMTSRTAIGTADNSKTFKVGYVVTANSNSGTIASTTGWTGTGTSATKVVLHDATIATLPNVSRTGYTLKGWFTASSGGTEVLASSSVSKATTIYAQWTINTFTVTIVSSNTNYGTVDIAEVKNVPYGTKITNSSNKVTINTKTVTATATTSDAQYTYAFSGWTNGSATVEGDLTVTANFTRTTNTYTVSIVSSNTKYGTVDISEVKNVPYGTKLTISYVDDTDDGGYQSGTVTINGTVVTATAETDTVQYDNNLMGFTVNGKNATNHSVTENITVSADFGQATKTYDITIKSNNEDYGYVSKSSVTVSYGTAITVNNNTLKIGSYTVTAYAAPSSAEYTYSFSYWMGTQDTVTTNLEITAFFARTANSYTLHMFKGQEQLLSSAEMAVASTVSGNNCTVTYSPEYNAGGYGGVWTSTPTSASDPYATLAQTVYLTSGKTYYIHMTIRTTSGSIPSGSIQLFLAIGGAYNEDYSVRFRNGGGYASFTAPSTGTYKLRLDNDYGTTAVKVTNFWIANASTTNYETVSVNYGSTYKLSDPSRTGYLFMGWTVATSSYSMNGSATTISGTASLSGSTLTMGAGDAYVFANHSLNYFTVTIDVSSSEYLKTSLSTTSYNKVYYGTPISAGEASDKESGSFTIGNTSVTVYPIDDTDQYDYFIHDMYTETESGAYDVTTVIENVTIHIYMSRSTQTYTVTFVVNNSSLGSVDTTKLTGIPYGASFVTFYGADADLNNNTCQWGQLTINGTPVKATAADDTAEFDYYLMGFTVGTSEANNYLFTSDTTVNVDFGYVTQTYNITYNLGGGSITGSMPTSYTYSSSVQNLTLGIPTNSSYYFNGGFTTNVTGVRVYVQYQDDLIPDYDDPDPTGDYNINIPAKTSGNLTITPTWIEKYKAYLYVDGTLQGYSTVQAAVAAVSSNGRGKIYVSPMNNSSTVSALSELISITNSKDITLIPKFGDVSLIKSASRNSAFISVASGSKLTLAGGYTHAYIDDDTYSLTIKNDAVGGQTTNLAPLINVAPGAELYVCGDNYEFYMDDKVSGSDLIIFENGCGTNGGAIYSAYSSSITATIDVRYAIFNNCRISYSGFVAATPTLGRGGAIDANTADLYVYDCSFSGCYGVYGGAISSDNSDASIERCTFTGNKALGYINTPATDNSPGYGGAIYSSVTISSRNNTFTSNSSTEDGGAIYSKTKVISRYDTFTSNTAGDDGGAIYSRSLGDIMNCIFKSNTAGSMGGAIWASGATIKSSTNSNSGIQSEYGTQFVGNVASSNGGAIAGGSNTIQYVWFSSNSAFNGGALYMSGSVSNSFLTQNKASGYGGATYGHGNLTVISSTFDYNTSASRGGAIKMYAGTLTVSGSRFMDNTAKSDGGGAILMYSGTISSSRFDSNTATAANGSAIYIENDSTVTLDSNMINDNTCTSDMWGAVFSQASVLYLKGNDFSSNYDSDTNTSLAGNYHSYFGNNLQDFSGTAYWDGTNTVDDSTISAKRITIRYVMNSGTNSSSNPTYFNFSFSSQTKTIYNPTRSSYTFNGWTVSGGTLSGTTLTIAAKRTSVITLTANWTKSTYTIYYEILNGNNNFSNAKIVNNTTTVVNQRASKSGSFSFTPGKTVTITISYYSGDVGGDTEYYDGCEVLLYNASGTRVSYNDIYTPDCNSGTKTITFSSSQLGNGYKIKIVGYYYDYDDGITYCTT